MSRIVCQFSCGAASAVATKLALAQYDGTHDVQIVNAFVKQEHEDNRRFLADCEGWFGRQITQLRDQKFGADIIQVFRRRSESRPGLGGQPALGVQYLSDFRSCIARVRVRPGFGFADRFY